MTPVGGPESETRLASLIANVPGAIYGCADDADWTMALISDEIEVITGYPASDFVDNARRSYASVIHPDDRDAVARDVEAAVRRGRPFALEYRVVRSDGSVRWVLERGQAVPREQGRWLDGAIFDVTERRIAEEALRESTAERARLEEVRASRTRIVSESYATRRQFERDLHDGAQQLLVSLALNLRLARARLQTDPAAVDELLEDALDELRLATHELRELARGLHPAVLTDRGLSAALQALADRTPLEIEMVADIDDRLPADVESAAYLVASEALANAAEHAGAPRARLELRRERDRAVLEIADDGVGGADPGTGTGLRGAVDRVAALDGDLEIDSPRGGGTRLRATIPLPE